MTDKTQVYIKVTGGNPMYQVTERILATQLDAARYLTEFGVTPTTFPAHIHKKVIVAADEVTFLLSHKLGDIFSDKTLEPSQLVEDMKAQVAVTYTKTGRPTPVTTPATVDISGLRSNTSKRPPTTNTATNLLPMSEQKPFKGDVVPLKEICQQLKMEPRAARAKLRKAVPNNGKQRWEWSQDEAVKIRDILSAK